PAAAGDWDLPDHIGGLAPGDRQRVGVAETLAAGTSKLRPSPVENGRSRGEPSQRAASGGAASEPMHWLSFRQEAPGRQGRRPGGSRAPEAPAAASHARSSAAAAPRRPQTGVSASDAARAVAAENAKARSCKRRSPQAISAYPSMAVA